ncbi:MAG: sigma factor-like helix-turn-helix DNA-binding protein [Patescibacteria group bacterium]|jgi:transcriptional regulator
MTDSILDKVIDSQKSAQALEFNPEEILSILLKNLKDREIEVLGLRYGFKDNHKRTLEEIGSQFKVTRERIRQIENSALKKIKSMDNLSEVIKSVEEVVNQVLESYGGIMHENSLIKKILELPGESPAKFSAAQFILSRLLNEKVMYLNNHDDLHNSWILPMVSLDSIKRTLDLLINLIKTKDKPLSAAEITEIVRAENLLTELSIEPDENVIESLLQTSKKISINPFNEWGLNHWQTISLKRMSDKIYLVLQKAGKPLHFTEIAKRINEIGFDKKKANPATIHNELILDDKYVLVGRGIYALTEWGFKPGVVSDVIEEVIKDAKRPLTREEIIERVSIKRLVKRSTIILALMNKAKFKKNQSGEYDLTQNVA